MNKNVLYQNWFANMKMVHEYYELQIFYDENVDCYYVVDENDKGNITIEQFVNGNEDYDRLVAWLK